MSKPPMTIVIMSRLYNNVAGGVERMSIALANAMCERGHDVHLLSWDHADATTHYPLDARITWHKLDMGDANVKAGWRRRISRIGYIRGLMREIGPDVVVGFQLGTFWNAVAATFGKSIRVVAAERNAPHRYDHLKAGKRRGLLLQTLRMADRITVQFPNYIDGYPPNLRHRIVAIENPVLPANGQANPAGRPGEWKKLISVGRLSYQKHQAVLIEAFALIAEKNSDWQLVFVGNGEDESKLRALVHAKGLEERIEFTGAVTDVSAHYRAAHLFCLSSRWEGFPNAIAEAMAHGLPCVGYRDCAGMPQLISDGETGALADGNGRAETLATALMKLTCDDAGRAEMGRKARETVGKYTPHLIFDRWEEMFRELTVNK